MILTPSIKLDILLLVNDNNIQTISELLKEIVKYNPKLDQIEVIDFWNKEIKHDNK